MSSIKTKLNVLRSKSAKYIAFRAWYAFQQKTGLLISRFPTTPKAVKTLSLAGWRAKADGYYFDSRESLQIPKEKNDQLKVAMQHMLQGDVLFFNKTWKPLGQNYDWITNPETGYKYDITQHWSKIESLSAEAGDIKYVWEKSRFS